MQRQSKTNWQNCSDSEINFFESCYEDGLDRIQMLGVPEYLRDAYEDYYAWRTTNEDGSVAILDDDY